MARIGYHLDGLMIDKRSKSNRKWPVSTGLSGEGQHGSCSRTDLFVKPRERGQKLQLLHALRTRRMPKSAGLWFRASNLDAKKLEVLEHRFQGCVTWKIFIASAINSWALTETFLEQLVGHWGRSKNPINKVSRILHLD